jgi:hypothetical protein
MIRKARLILGFILFMSLAFASCMSRKDEDFVIAANEVKSMQMKLKSSTLPIKKNDLENIIKSSAVTSTIRWELSARPMFLIKSKNVLPISAGSHVKKFWFIDKDFGIVFSN